MKEIRLVTGVCCQWRDRGSFDNDVLMETFILRGKFIGEIATEQQPPNRYAQWLKNFANQIIFHIFASKTN